VTATSSRLAGLAIAGLLVAGPGDGPRAEPFVPTDEALVLERLPAPGDQRVRQARALARELASRPDDLDLRLRLASDYLALARTEADPRYIGRAQGALGPSWAEAAPPVRVRLARASVRQAQHDFPGALVDIDAILAEEPDHEQALLERATLLEVQGDFAGAEAACARLARLRPGLVAEACLASARSLRGRAEASYKELLSALEAAPRPEPGILRWALTILGEIAARRGDVAAAGRHFITALERGPHDVYLRAAYADLLLDAGRPDAVLTLIGEGQDRIDTLYLRRALAAARLGAPGAAAMRDSLDARFRAARLRGDEIHLRDAARFALELQDDPRRALELAQRNWQLQRGPRDARMVLEAALVAGDRKAAQPVLDWLAATRIEDVKLAALAERLQGGAS
jgi:tetratricopeptide (TPR) repeat protein